MILYPTSDMRSKIALQCTSYKAKTKTRNPEGPQLTPHTGIDVYDCDGCLYPVSGSNPNPGKPAEVLTDWFRAHPRRRAIITGQPIGVARQVPDILRTDIDFICPDYGAVVYDSNGKRLAVLIPEDEQIALSAAKPILRRILEGIDGQEDDAREAEFNFTFFWGNSEKYKRAKEHLSSINDLTDIIQPGGRKLIRMQWNDEDHSINFLPATSSKRLAASWMRAQGMTIEIAAGDSGSDIPMLQIARFPIGTHDDNGVKATVAQVVTSRGGYVARSNERHGFGLVSGFQQMIEAA